MTLTVLRRAKERLVQGFAPHRRLDRRGPPWRMYDAVRAAAVEVIGPGWVSSADYYEALRFLNDQCGRSLPHERYHARHVQRRDGDPATTEKGVMKAVQQALQKAAETAGIPESAALPGIMGVGSGKGEDPS